MGKKCNMIFPLNMTKGTITALIVHQSERHVTLHHKHPRDEQEESMHYKAAYWIKKSTTAV